MTEMRMFTASKSAELKCPIMRLMQIEEQLGKHLGKACSVVFASSFSRAVLAVLLVGARLATFCLLAWLFPSAGRGGWRLH
ncbi:hypothetical protein Mal33_14470 [Rosistilla oblonga]|uniref:Uncharacterized protein n=1 Tax=Rosistilla oblonga TaxID=2527990 RepID=A0A518IQZ4_9BACT|nr:hypothetical protein Mal33_14470 [Rosistilla oblonga]